jgi:hypothetical protein
MQHLLSIPLVLAATTLAWGETLRPIELSGIYPHLAFFNDEGECGTGAVVPWAERLWVVTYAPHSPKGSSDKLYEITPALDLIVRPESIGGTPANRMIHRESNQLFIGPYAIGADRAVRVIPYTRMFGRPTANARHLSDPAGKIYYATMEEGIYEVDVKTLEVKELWTDEAVKDGRHARLPGYHGKGLYSGQGRLVYANNGERGKDARERPETPSGCLATWDGKADAWSVVRRNQFTEVTGPGGIHGSSHPETDPIWSIGWDHRSLILMVLDAGEWHMFRLPKASHSYDGAHGWNTEWPRIREIGEEDLLMTMHGMFWRFPKKFGAKNSAGIAPRSTYLKVIGDFARWGDRVVFGCDDTARNEFLNKRKAKGEIAAPQSQSNLWFVEPARLDRLGPVIARGAVWLSDAVTGGEPSAPFLFSGFARRALHLAHEGDEAAEVLLETDALGRGEWSTLRTVALPARGYQWIDLSDAPQAAWIRLRSPRALTGATAWFHDAGDDRRTTAADPIFDGIATAGEQRLTGGIVRARDRNQRTLHFTPLEAGPDGLRELGLYELDAQLKLRRVQDADAHAFQKKHAAIPVGVISSDAASVVFIDDSGRRWRLPRGVEGLVAETAAGPARVDREVATERDLFNAAGTFYELPAENAGGFAKLRPVATHGRQVVDYCSYRGLLILSGVALDAPVSNPHILRSDDGRTALWAGGIDDLWRFGKPRGFGGPWKDSKVAAGEFSDAFLMTGFDRKSLSLSHRGPDPVEMRMEIDLAGTGLWKECRRFRVEPGQTVDYEFPRAFQAYWVRFAMDRDAVATAQFRYE